MRLFVAIPLPEEVCDRLDMLAQMLPLPQRIDPDSYHLTLAFLGEVSVGEAEAAHAAFETVALPRFELTLAGVDVFGGGKPRLVYAGVQQSEPLMRLEQKVRGAVRLAGLQPEARRFVPHVTLARFRHRPASPATLERAILDCAGFRAGPFAVDRFVLYRSQLGQGGPVYDELADYPLG